MDDTVAGMVGPAGIPAVLRNSGSFKGPPASSARSTCAPPSWHSVGFCCPLLWGLASNRRGQQKPT
eukprot:8291939-Lingulodinium_polyedra.AAC.1